MPPPIVAPIGFIRPAALAPELGDERLRAPASRGGAPFAAAQAAAWVGCIHAAILLGACAI